MFLVWGLSNVSLWNQHGYSEHYNIYRLQMLNDLQTGLHTKTGRLFQDGCTVPLGTIFQPIAPQGTVHGLRLTAHITFHIIS